MTTSDRTQKRRAKRAAELEATGLPLYRSQYGRVFANPLLAAADQPPKTNKGVA